MFDGCSKLEQLSVKCEKLERARTTNMSSMFNGCTSLSDISFDEGSLASLTTASNMFARCDSITKESLLDMASKMPSLTGSHKIGIVNKFAEDVDIVSAFGMKGWTVVWV